MLSFINWDSNLCHLFFRNWRTFGCLIGKSLLRKSVKSKCDQSKANQCQDWRLMWWGQKSPLRRSQKMLNFAKDQIRKIRTHPSSIWGVSVSRYNCLAVTQTPDKVITTEVLVLNGANYQFQEKMGRCKIRINKNK